MAHPTVSLPNSSRPQLRIVGEEERPTYDGHPASQRAAVVAVIPNAVRELRDGDCLAIYDAIACHFNDEGEATPSLKAICEATGYSKNHVIRKIKRLEEAGILERHARFMNGASAATMYRLTANVRLSLPGTTLFTTGTGVVHQGNRGCSPEAQPPAENTHTYRGEPQTPSEFTPLYTLTTGNTENRESTKKENKRGVQGGTKPKQAYTPEFEAFWKEYPTGYGVKSLAFAEWSKLTDEDRAAAVKAIPAWQASEKWQGGFVRGCERWLKYREFEQTPPPRKRATNPNAGGQRRWVEG